MVVLYSPAYRAHTDEAIVFLQGLVVQVYIYESKITIITKMGWLGHVFL